MNLGTRLMILLAGSLVVAMAQTGLNYNDEAVLRILNSQGPRLFVNRGIFTCSTLVARPWGIRNRLAVALAPSLTNEVIGGINGEAAVGPLLRELFDNGAEFRVDHWERRKLRMVAVALFKQGERDVAVYVDPWLGTIDGVVLRGYPMPGGIVAMQCWALG